MDPLRPPIHRFQPFWCQCSMAFLARVVADRSNCRRFSIRVAEEAVDRRLATASPPKASPSKILSRLSCLQTTFGPRSRYLPRFNNARICRGVTVSDGMAMFQAEMAVMSFKKAYQEAWGRIGRSTSMATRTVRRWRHPLIHLPNLTLRVQFGLQLS